MEFIDSLIGARLVSIDENKMVIKRYEGYNGREEKEYTFEIIQNEGDCCGFNEVNAKLLCEEGALIGVTNVSVCKGETDDESYCTITLFGEYKPIAMLSSRSSSGSGYQYGAYVKIKCKPLDIDEFITAW